MILINSASLAEQYFDPQILIEHIAFAKHGLFDDESIQQNQSPYQHMAEGTIEVCKLTTIYHRPAIFSASQVPTMKSAAHKHLMFESQPSHIKNEYFEVF